MSYAFTIVNRRRRSSTVKILLKSYKRNFLIKRSVDQIRRKVWLDAMAQVCELLFMWWLVLMSTRILKHHWSSVLKKPKEIWMAQFDNYTNQIYSEQNLSIFGGISKRVNSQLSFGMKFIPFAILALSVCICFGEIGRSTSLAKLIGSRNTLNRRIIVLIVMVIFCITHQMNNALIDLTDDFFLQIPFLSMVILQLVGFFTCVIFACICGVTFAVEKTK